MIKKHSLLQIFVFISVLTMNFRCMKDEISRPLDYSFEAAVDLFPIKKSYSLTDTIWIETDLPSKYIFDTKSNQSIFADTGQINFGAVFNQFGTAQTNPQNGFCEVFSVTGVNVTRQLGQWSTEGIIYRFGCGKQNYKCRVGFKPNQKGTYWLTLSKDVFFESCSNKVIPYNAQISYKYKDVDLNLDVFNALPPNDKGGNSGTKFYTDMITSRRGFVFKVE